MMRTECVLALSMLHFIKNSLFLWLVKRLLIRSVLFLSINPSELEKIVLGAFSLALFVYISTDRLRNAPTTIHHYGLLM